MQQTRRRFHDELAALEREVAEVGEMAQATLARSVDALNRGMALQVVRLASDPARLEWGIRMNVVARQLERVGDHAVDIGEQVGFLLTGEFREFTDASHPSATDTSSSAAP